MSYEDEFRFIDTNTGRYLNDTIKFYYQDQNEKQCSINQKQIEKLILRDRETALKFAGYFKITDRYIAVVHSSMEYIIVFDDVPEDGPTNQLIKEINKKNKYS